MGGEGRAHVETAMSHLVEPHPPVDAREHEHHTLPLVVALAVLGPLALAFALAVVAAFAS